MKTLRFESPGPARRQVFLAMCVAAVWLIPSARGQSAALDSLVTDAVNASQVADTVLAGRIRRAFASLDDFRSVEVEVHDGVVRLSGAVVEPTRREQAGELAAAFPGVVYVINDLENNLEVEARVTPAIERIRSYLRDAVAYMPVIGIAVLVLLVFGLIAGLIDKLLPSFQRLGLSQLAGSLVVRLMRAFLWMIGLVMALDILGITALVGAVLGTAGLMGIAIGFAFQDIIENYLAGLILSARRPFRLNDYIKIGADEGKVVRLTSRELVLMTLEGNHVRIPNATVFKSTIYNFTLNPRRRFSFDTGIDVEEDLQRVQRIGMDTLDGMESIMKDPAPFSLVRELGESNVLVTFYGWVDQAQFDFAKARSESIRLVKNALDEAGVLMPEPIYNVRMQTVSKDLAAEARDRIKQPTLAVQKEGDVAVETDIETQIQEELSISDEPNLLEENEGMRNDNAG